MPKPTHFQDPLTDLDQPVLFTPFDSINQIKNELGGLLGRYRLWGYER